MTAIQVDFSSPLVSFIPAEGRPTEILVARFQSWRKFIKALNSYLSHLGDSQDDISRLNVRLEHSVSTLSCSISDEATFLPPGSGGVRDIAQQLALHHRSQASIASRSSHEILQIIVPRLDQLRKDLSGKIREIQSLSNDFKSSIAIERAATATALEALKSSLDSIQNAANSITLPTVKNTTNCNIKNDNTNSPTTTLSSTDTNSSASKVKNIFNLSNKSDSNNKSTSNNSTSNEPTPIEPKISSPDPYLLRIAAERQIKKQLDEESYLHDAYLNLEGSGRELERIVVQEIQQSINTIAKFDTEQSQEIINAVKLLETGFVGSEPSREWDSFIAADTHFVNPTTPRRSFADISYYGQHEKVAFEVRSGWLERRSKYLKSYTRGFYVLTPTHLHEFKSADRNKDITPVMSLSLGDCSLQKFPQDGSSSSSHKFILYTKQNGGFMSKGHKWVFRAGTDEAMKVWYNDIKRLSSLSLKDRVTYGSALVQGQSQPNQVSNVASLYRKSFETSSTMGKSAVTSIYSGVDSDDNAEVLTHEIDPEPEQNSPIGNRRQDGGKFAPNILFTPSSNPNSTNNSLPTGSSPNQPVVAAAAAAVGSSDKNKKIIKEENSKGNGTKNVSDDESSVYSYDIAHPSASTFRPNEEPDIPHTSSIPTSVERKMSITRHQDESPDKGIGAARDISEVGLPAEKVKSRRKDSVNSITSDKSTRRKPTGTFGQSLKPLTSLDNKGKQQQQDDDDLPLFFAGGIPSVTSSGNKENKSSNEGDTAANLSSTEDVPGGYPEELQNKQ